jgi:hypothetical protein
MRHSILCLFIALPGLTAAQWTGSINLNASLAQNVRNSTSLLILGDAKQKLPAGELTLKALLAYSRQSVSGGVSETTEDRGSLFAQYDFTLNSRSFGYANAGLDYDKVQLLDLRTLIGAGVGWYVFRSPEFRRAGDADWKVTTGLAYIAEDYRFGGDNSRIGLQLGSEYRRKLADTVDVLHTLLFIPAFNDFGNYYLTSDLQLRTSLGRSWQATLGWLFTYTSEPAPGIRKDTSNFVLGIGYKF